MATMKKAQSGAKVKKTFKSNPDSGGVAPFTAKEQTERRKKLGLPTSDKEKKAYYAKMSKEGARNGKSMTKAKNGKSFPDLNKDGKVTKADILKGRGVIAKKGAKIKKAGMHKMPDGSMMKNSAMKSGGAMKKCKYGCK